MSDDPHRRKTEARVLGKVATVVLLLLAAFVTLLVLIS